GGVAAAFARTFASTCLAERPWRGAIGNRSGRDQWRRTPPRRAGVRRRWITPPGPEPASMDAFLTSTAIVALAEMGDKTQLLAILLAARFRRPAPIILGILVATLANHALAALVGSVAAQLLDGDWFARAVGLGFIAMGIWTLIP